MKELLEALKRKQGAKIIIVDMEGEGTEDAPEEGESPELEAKSAKEVLGYEPFADLKPRKSLEMNGEDDDEEEGESLELEGMDKELADEQVMNRLKNGKKPSGIMERAQANLMKKNK